MKRWLIALFCLLPLAAAGPEDDTMTVAFERVMLTLDSYATSERWRSSWHTTGVIPSFTATQKRATLNRI